MRCSFPSDPFVVDHTRVVPGVTTQTRTVPGTVRTARVDTPAANPGVDCSPRRVQHAAGSTFGPCGGGSVSWGTDRSTPAAAARDPIEVTVMEGGGKQFVTVRAVNGMYGPLGAQACGGGFEADLLDGRHVKVQLFPNGALSVETSTRLYGQQKSLGRVSGMLGQPRETELTLTEHTPTRTVETLAPAEVAAQRRAQILAALATSPEAGSHDVTYLNNAAYWTPKPGTYAHGQLMRGGRPETVEDAAKRLHVGAVASYRHCATEQAAQDAADAIHRQQVAARDAFIEQQTRCPAPARQRVAMERALADLTARYNWFDVSVLKPAYERELALTPARVLEPCHAAPAALACPT